MQALPRSIPRSPDTSMTGVTCPDCFGALEVYSEGSQHLVTFRCRIGHTYSAEETVIGKERLIEEYLWSAVTALDELATLLRNLLARDRVRGPDREAFERRAEDAEAQRDQIRRAINEHSPVALHKEMALNEGV